MREMDAVPSTIGRCWILGDSGRPYPGLDQEICGATHPARLDRAILRNGWWTIRRSTSASRQDSWTGHSKQREFSIIALTDGPPEILSAVGTMWISSVATITPDQGTESFSIRPDPSPLPRPRREYG